MIEGRVGGRIYERPRDGPEHDWGVVTAARSRSRGTSDSDPSDAREVAVRFVADDATRTRVEIEHSGWERLADDPIVRDRTRANRSSVVNRFAEHASSEGAS